VENQNLAPNSGSLRDNN